jgi:8-oxo-dGTP pyrophosphatase MutT (NUDIX family)
MTRPRILNPRSVPVIGTDAHLPAVAAAHLTPQALRQRFLLPQALAPEFAGDGRLFSDREPAAASVLVPLVQRPDGLRVLLTMRTEHLNEHAGQISFPGGRAEDHDADEVATALRETEEEIGLPRSHIEVIGRLPIYTTITRFTVTPVIALVTPPFELKLDEFEVAEAFEVPLAYLMTPAHHQRHLFQFAGESRNFLSMPWRTTAPGGDEREYFVWGATAAMLRNLYRVLVS